MKFEDISLVPAPMSYVRSRNDVDTSGKLFGNKLSIPLISSNMTSVFSPEQSKIILDFGGMSVVHRFCSIEENVRLFLEGSTADKKPFVSVGVSLEELKRAEALVKAGATTLVLEVANAASIVCVEQYNRLYEAFPDVALVVGTFATKDQLQAFLSLVKGSPEAVLVGVGNGSACLTGSDVTGINIPICNTIIDVAQVGLPVIVSGGISKPSDLMKCLALGASAVMSGKLFAACYESGAKGFYKEDGQYFKDKSSHPRFKYYYGSASEEAYGEQDKKASWRPVEGKGMMIPASGSTLDMLQYYQSSLKSTMSYINANNISQLKRCISWKYIDEN